MSASLIKQAVRRVGVERLVSELGPQGLQALRYEWDAWARPEQLPPSGDWRVWLILAGRGWGKSRTGAEWVRQQAKTLPGSHGALVAPTAADARDVMVKAIVNACPESEGCVYESSKRRVSWRNGSSATLYSAEEPDRLRGPNHAWGWGDEVAAWQKGGEVWDMLQMTMRIGERPLQLVTTTPRPIELLSGNGENGRRLGIMRLPGTVITYGATFDNADNLSPQFITGIKAAYGESRLGRQELYGELLTDVEGALWKRDWFAYAKAPELRRIVVAVDPSGSAKQTADEAGVVVAGVANGHMYVLEDLTGRYSPRDMAAVVCKAYHDWKADCVVAEDNFGGVMIRDLLHLTDKRVAYKRVHASRGKHVRAEPVAALYEAKRVSHVRMLAKLEDELCSWTPLSGLSPGRLDALVWAGHELMLGQDTATFRDYEPIAARRI